MSYGEVRTISLEEIQRVQDLIEMCLQNYQDPAEIATTLYQSAKIEPLLTELLLRKLEEDNQDFFTAYRERLVVRDQILRFNELLEIQVELMNQMSQQSPVSTPLFNGLPTLSMNSYSAYQNQKPSVPSVNTENMHHTIGVMPNCCANGTCFQQESMQVAVGMAVHNRRVNVPMNMSLAHSSDEGIMNGFRGQMMGPDCYACDPPVMSGAVQRLPECCNVINEAQFCPPCCGQLSCSQSFSDTMLEPELISLAQLEQMNQSFGLPDLTDEIHNNTDMQFGYPFLGSNDHLGSHHIRQRGHGMDSTFHTSYMTGRCIR